jgi:hypothetical protein
MADLIRDPIAFLKDVAATDATVGLKRDRSVLPELVPIHLYDEIAAG